MHAAAQDATAEEARHDAAQEHQHYGAEEAAQADTPAETEHHTPGDTHTPPDTHNPDEIQDVPDTHAADNAGRTVTVSGPSSGMDLYVTLIPPAVSTSAVLNPHSRSTSTSALHIMLYLLLPPCTTSRGRPP